MVIVCSLLLGSNSGTVFFMDPNLSKLLLDIDLKIVTRSARLWLLPCCRAEDSIMAVFSARLGLSTRLFVLLRERGTC